MLRNSGSVSEAFANPEAHEESCRVYWGSHGCDRPRGHDGPHWCECCTCEPGEHPNPVDEDGDEYLCVGGPPYYGDDTRFFGEDYAEGNA